MYVPRGKWFNYWTDEIITGGKEMWVDADIDSTTQDMVAQCDAGGKHK